MAIELITGTSGTPHISSDDVRAFNRAMFGNGNYIVSGCAAQITGPNSVHINAGELMLGGAHVRITGGGETATIENGAAGKIRTDYICVRYVRNSGGIEGVEINVTRGADFAVGTTPVISPPSGHIANNDSIANELLYLVDVTASGLSNLRTFGITPSAPVFNVDNPVPVEYGGTGRASFTNRSILVGNESGGINQLAPTHGALYVPSDGEFPRYGNLPIASGGTGGATAAEARANLGLDDTGWNTLASGTNWYVRYRRVGSLVEICGESTGGKAIGAGKYVDIATLPSSIAPTYHASNTRFIIGTLGIMGAEPIAAEVLVTNTTSGGNKKLQLYASSELSYWHFNAMYFV